ncbi:MAG TPA: histidine kinase [Candidatus Eisenbergiella merdavium]|uniref:Histidine kinase n=1 Tax=Candidatus Eisenbergiella merdavium TaxID=2838551 RepID=A0A9D2SP35_9FIRM|nr:histidine kinase [Candidatus Eisenbergiella merdavium]
MKRVWGRAVRPETDIDEGRRRMTGGKLQNSLFGKFLVIVIVLLLCMAGSVFITNHVVRSIARENTELSNDKILRQIDAKTSEFHNSLYNMLTLLAYEQTTYNYFTQTALERLNAYESLISLFSNTMMIQDDIAGIALYDEHANKLVGTGKDFDIFTDVKMESKLAYSNVFRPNSSTEAYFMVSYPVYDLMKENYDRQLGMLVLLIKASRFSSYFTDTAITENERLYLADRNNVVIAGDEDQELKRLSEEDLRNTPKRYVQIIPQKETGWKIISIIPVSELYSSMNIVQSFILIIWFITLLGLVILLGFCYCLIIKPIRRVDLFVRNSVRYPTRRLAVKGADEISVLAGNLNHMLNEKDEMSEKLRHSQRILYETELAKQQMQVLAYRNQINPHFLYNTFECIRAMALYYDADEIAEITMALSRIFRYAIKGDNVVSVADEISNIREYARIIHYRFGGRICVEIDMEDGVRDRQMIKLILQPIVENSIFHGLEQKLDGGRVVVSARAYGQKGLVLEVADDGCGMEKERVEYLMYQIKRQSLHRSSEKDSIGLANIYHRLWLFYGEKADFKMESSPGCGTRVRIVLPGNVEGREEKHV